MRFSPIDGLSPFRRLETDAPFSGTGGLANPLIGLPEPDLQAISPSEAQLQAAQAAPFAALYPDLPGSASVPIAYFTDIRCPNCRQVEAMLARLQAEDPALYLVTHEYPIFGAPSIAAARLILAAAQLGQAEALRRRLQRSRIVVDAASAVLLAEDLGIDADLYAQATAPEITEQLQVSRALAALFAFPGTPALVVGRTTVLGALAEDDLRQLIALEREERSWLGV